MYKNKGRIILFGAAAYAASKYGISFYRKQEMYKSDSQDNSKPIKIFIWDTKLGQTLGHASILLDKNRYLSFWPARDIAHGDKDELKEGVTAFTPPFLQSLDGDMEEPGKPDHEYVLKNLDNEKMIKEFENIIHAAKEGRLGYCVAGRSFVENEKCMNCVTSVFRILTAGGLEKIAVIDDAITTPKHLRDILDVAVKNQNEPVKNNSNSFGGT